jgi:hypothetical protein
MAGKDLQSDRPVSFPINFPFFFFLGEREICRVYFYFIEL